MLTSAVEEKNTLSRYWSGVVESALIGPVSILVSEAGLAVAEFAPASEFARQLIVPVETVSPAPDVLRESLEQIKAYLEGKLRVFTMPVDLRGMSDFARQVLLTARNIPFGQVRTYGSLAAAAGFPGAARAVGGVMSRNPIPLVIPCHRVVASDGTLHGYSAPGGLETKSRLLELEGHPMANLRLQDKSWKTAA